jgi:F-type H+-transporting ATPase subunit epsilon
MSPVKVLAEAETIKVLAPGTQGPFCLLPHHSDFVAQLVPGPLTYEDQGNESSLELDGGLLIKTGDRVLVTTRPATGLEQQRREALEVVDALESRFTATLLGEKDHG